MCTDDIKKFVIVLLEKNLLILCCMFRVIETLVGLVTWQVKGIVMCY